MVNSVTARVTAPAEIAVMSQRLTRELIVDKLRKTGVVAPPEKPELSATRSVVPSPHAQHVRRQASAETTQDRVLLGHGEKDGRRGGSLPHKSPPFYPSQISLK